MDFKEHRREDVGTMDFQYSLTGQQLNLMKGQVATVIADNAAKQLTEEFVKNFGQAVIAKIDIQVVANLAMVRAVDQLAQAIAGRVK